MLQPDFFRRMPLWQTPLTFLVGLGLIGAGLAMAEALHVYLVALLVIGGKLLTTLATVVLVFGYLDPALRRLIARILRRIS